MKRLSFVTDDLGWRGESFVTKEMFCEYAFMPDGSRCQYLDGLGSCSFCIHPLPCVVFSTASNRKARRAKKNPCCRRAVHAVVGSEFAGARNCANSIPAQLPRNQRRGRAPDLYRSEAEVHNLDRVETTLRDRRVQHSHTID